MKNAKAKRAVIAGFVAVVLVLCVLTAVWAALELYNYNAKMEVMLRKPPSVNQEYSADFDYDPYRDSEFLDQNLYIKYTDHTGSLSTTITDGNYADYGDGMIFFNKYFTALRNGEYKSFDELFDDSYFKTEEHTDTDFGFTKQSIYDIEIAYAKKYSSGGLDYSVYEVKYKILKNDGSFRGDIGSRQYRPQYFTLVSNGKETKIHRISYSYDPNFDFSQRAMLNETVSLIAAVAIAAVTVIAVIAVKAKNKKKSS